MKHILTIASVLTILASAPAFAAGSACSSAPKSAWKPQSTLKAKLKAEGLKVRRIKEEGGCYEVYAINSKGKRVNMAYNAETLKKAPNAEAGEQ
ncbi:MAG TPA: PepSY domain-containing protein [Pararhizobium sp.]|nr:PepSY domain-containing protein [Pararhizobium sp.]